MPRARYLMTRRIGWWGIALTAWDLWRRIPKEHRKRILREVRHYAPMSARQVTREVRRMRDAARNTDRSR